MSIILAGLEQNYRPKAFFCGKCSVLAALQQVFLTLLLMESSGLGMKLRSSDFSVLPLQVTALGSPATHPVAKQNNLDFKCLCDFCPNSLWASSGMQTSSQPRCQDGLQDSSGFGLEGEVSKPPMNVRCHMGFMDWTSSHHVCELEKQARE